ncbi:NADPH2:quinone reductase [Oxalobacteraceae bacterium GrIS 1.11]
MKAIRFHRHGGPEVLTLEQVEQAVAAPGETLVRVHTAGVNFTDVYQRSGLTPTALPWTPGVEGMGTVAARSACFEPGTRVAWAGHPGAYAQFASIPDWKLVALPDAMDGHTAAACLLQGITSQYLCESSYVVKAGDVALVHAGAGGVGLLLIQLLKLKGAHVLSTVSNATKAALARQAGADEVIIYTETDFVEAVRAATGGKGVHVAYDSVGKNTYAGSMSLVRPLGTLVLYGQSSGLVPPIDPLQLSKQGSIFLIRPTLAHYVADADSMAMRAGKVLQWVVDGSLKVRIDHVYRIDQAAVAHAALEARSTSSKLLLDIPH